jgi:hypothetical protein
MWKIALSLLTWVLKRMQYKSRLEGKVDLILNTLAEHKRRLLRLEIIAAIDRNDRAVVHQLYDEYKALGGNSYIQELYKNYCKNPRKRSKK